MIFFMTERGSSFYFIFFDGLNDLFVDIVIIIVNLDTECSRKSTL